MNLSSFLSTSTFVIAALVILFAVGAFAYYRLFKRRQGGSNASKGRNHRSGSNDKGRYDNAQPNQQLYVGNLPFRSSDDDLYDMFYDYGDIVEARVIRDRRSGRSKGFGFITFEEQEAATQALEMHQRDCEGRVLVVRYAKPPA